MKIVNGSSAYRVQRCLAAAFLLALTGCVSAVSEDKDASVATAPAVAAALPAAPNAEQAHLAANQHAVPGYVDPAMVSGNGGQASPTVAAAAQTPGTPQVYGQAPQMSGLATQPTGISASSLSIYASSASPVVPAASGPSTGNIPAYSASPKVVPAFNSVYSTPAGAPPPQAGPAPVPQENSAVTPMPNAAQKMAAQTEPVSGKLPADPSGVPIAAFFASAAKKRGAGATQGLTQIAALPAPAQAGIALAGRSTMSDAFDDSHAEDDDKPAGLMKLASLSGLSRVAPNGLLLQTEQVNVGCFKPEMIRRIKEVETHYGRRAMVTSGYRPPKATTQGSKHYTCDAADIQVTGVSKWELANYLRSIPDRGGVGTYCHTESVHMDLGEPRDWNWRCRRTSKSL
ncbi:YcbK family protein [Agrobacterium sp. rho-8.1]|nr:YcbK family protein [Agrobacterium sp. rho-8.1]